MRVGGIGYFRLLPPLFKSASLDEMSYREAPTLWQYLTERIPFAVVWDKYASRVIQKVVKVEEVHWILKK